MAYFYSFGITFSSDEEAQHCSDQLTTQKILLSNNSQVDLHGDIRFIDTSEWLVTIYPKGMAYPGTNLTLFKTPYYYEIRKFFISYLKETSLNFRYALFEFEAADTLLSDNLRNEILENNILFEKSEDGAHWFIQNQNESFPRDYYQARAYYDGLVISEEIYLETGKRKEFIPFKSGYYWIAETAPGF